MVSGIVRDLLAVVGLLLVASGCWMAWRPLGLIVPGALILAAVAWSLRGPANDP